MPAVRPDIWPRLATGSKPQKMKSNRSFGAQPVAPAHGTFIGSHSLLAVAISATYAGKRYENGDPIFFQEVRAAAFSRRQSRAATNAVGIFTPQPRELLLT
jgi:hypothetical protein